MLLSTSLRIQPKDIVAFVGGGGKTTAMFCLADELVAQDRRVITTTTTRIFAAQIKMAPYHITSSSEGRSHEMFLSRVQAELAANSHILITGETSHEGKAFGVSPELVEELIAIDGVDAVIYEADGSRMRPFKAPASHEPVLASRTKLLVPVVGISALGAPLDDGHVHRAELVAQLASAKLGDPVTVEMIARVITHREGGIKSKPSGARATVLVNAVENDEQLESARRLARHVLGSNKVEAVAIGAVRTSANPIRETHRPIAAIITAAGAGVRMQGRIKQLLPWRGKSLIENAIEIATQSDASETIVVLGAHADEIRGVIRAPRTQMVVNSEWDTGHASSIRAALDAVSPMVDAAIFINVDQPLLTPTVVNRMVQRYRETDAEIITPVYAGKRGSPVLFRRVHFDGLRSLRGDQGGRELVAKYADRVERVAFDDERLGVDVDTIEEFESLVGSER
jgi:molybdenum cofactor cytidylyltransferase